MLGGCFDGNSFLIHESGGNANHVKFTSLKLKTTTTTCVNPLARICNGNSELACDAKAKLETPLNQPSVCSTCPNGTYGVL